MKVLIRKKITKSRLRSLMFLLLLLLPCIMHAQAGEYEVKAAFLGKFCRFVQWPVGEINDAPDKTFNIAILGKNPFGHLLDQMYRNHNINDRPVRLHYIHKIEQLRDAQILFIAGSEKKKLTKILLKLNKPDLLTVSDTPGFGNLGVIINFYVQDDKVRFEINYSALQKSDLKMSYLLLELARIIGKKDETLH